MSVRQWWRERLVAGVPFYHPAHVAFPRHMWYYFKNDAYVAGWPRAVHSTTLYEDYLVWFEEKYLPSIDAPYYQDFPEKRPIPVPIHQFWNEFGEYSEKTKVFERLVPVCKKNMDKWVNILQMRRFREITTLAAGRARYEALHPDDPLEAPARPEPGAGARRVRPEDAGSWT